MITPLRDRFPNIPDLVLWKTELLFHGVRFTEALAQAAAEGAAPNFWPYQKRNSEGKLSLIPVPYLFRLEGGAVARLRVDDRSSMAVQRANGRFTLWSADQELCGTDFVRSHAWQQFRTSDGATPFKAGVEQLGDMLVVNVAPGCEYFRVKTDSGDSQRCSFCAYGRFDQRSQALGQVQGRVAGDANTLRRLGEVLAVAVEAGEAHHVYITGGSLLNPEQEAERFLPVIETARRAVGERLRVTCGSGAVDPAGILMREGPVEMGFRVAWIEPDGVIEIRDGAIELARGGQGLAAIVISRAEIGVQADRLIVVLDCPVLVSLLVINDTTVVKCISKAWI